MASISSSELRTKTESYYLATAQEEAISDVRHALTANAFSNGKLLRPRRLAEIARQEVEAFVHHAGVNDGEVTRQRGRQLAGHGLGHRSMLHMAEALRRAGHNGLGNDEQAVSDYVVALLEGYMVGREQNLLQEQSRTVQALIRVRSRASGE
jgi:hypothetical protein